MKLNKKEFNKWLIALYEEKYPRGRHALQSAEGFSSSGVGCMVLIPKKLLSKTSQGLLFGLIPWFQPFAPLWFKEIGLDFKKKTGEHIATIEDNGYNDYKFFSHPEIAMLLDLVYNYKILEA